MRKIYDPIIPHKHWVWIENEDGTVTDHNPFPVNKWKCGHCRTPVGYHTWYTNTYTLTHWADAYIPRHKNPLSERLLKLCSECAYKENNQE